MVQPAGSLRGAGRFSLRARRAGIAREYLAGFVALR